jgi:hypothetical protein
MRSEDFEKFIQLGKELKKEQENLKNLNELKEKEQEQERKLKKFSSLAKEIFSESNLQKLTINAVLENKDYVIIAQKYLKKQEAHTLKLNDEFWLFLTENAPIELKSKIHIKFNDKIEHEYNEETGKYEGEYQRVYLVIDLKPYLQDMENKYKW